MLHALEPEAIFRLHWTWSYLYNFHLPALHMNLDLINSTLSFLESTGFLWLRFALPVYE